MRSQLSENKATQCRNRRREPTILRSQAWAVAENESLNAPGYTQPTWK
jgi:hypothetical protein